MPGIAWRAREGGAGLRDAVAFAAAKESGQSVSAAMAPVVEKYANSGELNFRIDDKDAAIARVVSAFLAEGAPERTLDFDGVRLDYRDWWVSLRKSNTEPYLRLLLEARDEALLADRLAVAKTNLGVA